MAFHHAGARTGASCGDRAAARGRVPSEERRRVEGLVTRASRRAWSAYMAEIADLARAADPSEAREHRARRSREPQQPETWTPGRALMTITEATPLATARLHARAARAPGARAPLRGRGAHPPRGGGRAGGRQDLRRAARAHQARGDRGAPLGRAALPGVRRAGLDEDRVVPGRGAARAARPTRSPGTCPARTTCWPAEPRSRSSATSSRRCAASCTTPTP